MFVHITLRHCISRAECELVKMKSSKSGTAVTVTIGLYPLESYGMVCRTMDTVVCVCVCVCVC